MTHFLIAEQIRYSKLPDAELPAFFITIKGEEIPLTSASGSLVKKINCMCHPEEMRIDDTIYYMPSSYKVCLVSFYDGNQAEVIIPRI